MKGRPILDRVTGPKIEFIQILRGLAALIVVWWHLGPAFVGARDMNWWPVTAFERVVSDPLHVYQDGGNLGVLVFFLISGFIITHASLSEDRWQFAVKRVLRIFPLLLFALLITVGAELAAMGAGWQPLRPTAT